MRMRKYLIAAALAATCVAAHAGLILSELVAPPIWWLDLSIAIGGLEPIGPIRVL